MGELQQDMDMTTDMFARHKVLSPDSRRIFIMGTHEHRWMKYLMDKAAPTSKLRSNRIENLYKLAENGIEYVGYERGLLVNGTFLIIHGDIAVMNSLACRQLPSSRYTAKRHFDKKGGSGMCNHTHRLGSFYKTNRFGIYGWWENGCLCTLKPDWTYQPDWQNGFAMIHFKEGGHFHVQPLPIIDGSFMYGGEYYGG